MITICVASQKGGSGKSTLAVHLAACAQTEDLAVLILDADPQASVSAWRRVRKEEYPLVAPMDAGRLKEVLAKANTGGVDVCIIDTPPHAGTVIEAASRAADITLVPVRPAFFDLQALPPMQTLVHGNAAVVLNQCPPSRGFGEASVTTEARKAAALIGWPVARISITKRVDLEHALIGGTTVLEFAPNSKAAKEMRKLWTWIREEIK